MHYGEDIIVSNNRTTHSDSPPHQKSENDHVRLGWFCFQNLFPESFIFVFNKIYSKTIFLFCYVNLIRLAAQVAHHIYVP